MLSFAAMDKPKDLITTTAARKLLGVGTAKMTGLIKEGVVRTYPNPLDKRVKLVSKSQVLGLMPMMSAEAA